MLRINSKSLGNRVVSPEEENERLQWEGFAEKEGFKNSLLFDPPCISTNSVLPSSRKRVDGGIDGCQRKVNLVQTSQLTRRFTRTQIRTAHTISREQIALSACVAYNPFLHVYTCQ